MSGAAVTVPRWLLVAMIALSSPLSLGVETGLRRLLFPPDFELLRAFLRERLTPVAWGCAAAVVVGGVAAVPLQRWLVARMRKTRGGDRDGSGAVAGLYLATTVPQLPALVATLLFTFGSDVRPVLVAVGLAAVCVVGVAVTSPAR